MTQGLIIAILSIFLPLIGGGIGFYLKYFIEKKKELTSQIAIERREHYQQFIDIIIDMWANTKSKGSNKGDPVKELFKFYKKYVIYASPQVIIYFSDYFQFLYNEKAEDYPNPSDHSKKHILKLTKIMVEMRKDLGLNNKGLGNDGEILFRALIKDYDTFIK